MSIKDCLVFGLSSLDVFALPSKTEDLLKRDTFNHMMNKVRNDLDKFMMDEVLEAIEAEYQYCNVDVDFKQLEVCEDREDLNDHQTASKFFSFDAMHCLPSKITISLFERANTEESVIEDVETQLP